MPKKEKITLVEVLAVGTVLILLLGWTTEALNLYTGQWSYHVPLWHPLLGWVAFAFAATLGIALVARRVEWGTSFLKDADNIEIATFALLVFLLAILFAQGVYQ